MFQSQRNIFEEKRMNKQKHVLGVMKHGDTAQQIYFFKSQ